MAKCGKDLEKITKCIKKMHKKFIKTINRKKSDNTFYNSSLHIKILLWNYYMQKDIKKDISKSLSCSISKKSLTSSPTVITNQSLLSFYSETYNHPLYGCPKLFFLPLCFSYKLFIFFNISSSAGQNS